MVPRMKVSGFTFIRNAVSLGFPALESIRSVLPICDEFVVNVGHSDDGTLDPRSRLSVAKSLHMHTNLVG